MRKPYANKHAHLAHAQITQTQKRTLLQLEQHRSRRLLALPWCCWLGNVGAHNAATPRDLPPLPRSPSTEHRAGLISVGSGSYTMPILPLMVELGVAVEATSVA